MVGCTSSNSPPPTPTKKATPTPFVDQNANDLQRQNQEEQEKRDQEEQERREREEEEESDAADCPRDNGTNSNCPKVPRSDIDVEEKGGFDATVGRQTIWRFDAESNDKEFKDRIFTVFAVEIETRDTTARMEVVDNDSEDVSVRWTPSNRSPPRGTLKVSVRDMTRCESLEDDCDDFRDEKDCCDTIHNEQWDLNDSGTNNNRSGGGSSTLAIVGAVLPLLTGLITGQPGGGGFSNIFSLLTGGNNLGNNNYNPNGNRFYGFNQTINQQPFRQFGFSNPAANQTFRNSIQNSFQSNFQNNFQSNFRNNLQNTIQNQPYRYGYGYGFRNF